MRSRTIRSGFQFLGIPPKGERAEIEYEDALLQLLFPISRDPPEGGTSLLLAV